MINPEMVGSADSLFVRASLLTLTGALTASFLAWIIAGNNKTETAAAPSFEIRHLLAPAGAWILTGIIISQPICYPESPIFVPMQIPGLFILVMALRDLWSTLLNRIGAPRPAGSESWNRGLTNPLTPASLWLTAILCWYYLPFWNSEVVPAWFTSITESGRFKITENLIILTTLLMVPILPLLLEGFSSNGRKAVTRFWNLLKPFCTAIGFSAISLFTLQGLVLHCFHHDILGFPIYRYPEIASVMGPILKGYAMSCRAAWFPVIIWGFWIILGIHRGAELVCGMTSVAAALRQFILTIARWLINSTVELMKGCLNGIYEFINGGFRLAAEVTKALVWFGSAISKTLRAAAFTLCRALATAACRIASAACQIAETAKRAILSLGEIIFSCFRTLGRMMKQISEKGISGLISAIYFETVNRLFNAFTRILGTDKVEGAKH
ncbi:MAG: hypothetical protein CVV64_12135 [Candidatus Wallbacteria bacterium HGW-Wallbacteria-1]|jgi:histone H3/H4|uniref:Uncharacterized protein n=1 Tax=Candidatus Wallbacteria bacterium HGW-Wallbacteria-1 TaxID=2013854 RepID=A0A2N1PNG0_9BACT|nr:MAG: hypothetical protein CVV64_12135 [Candidatus Wallbacteria bacterium HGW-Wallbacteria-1]